MKKTFTQAIGSLLGILVVAVIAVTMTTTSAHALLAGGTTISNTAHVDWDEDGTGLGQDSPPVNVTVNLVSGLTWDDTSLTNSLVPSYTETVAPGAAITAYTIDLLNTGSGATTVSLSDGTVDGANLNADSAFVAAATAPHDLTLAGTISTGADVFAAGETTIPVSYIDTTNLNATTRIHVNGSTAGYFLVNIGATTQTSLVLIGDATGAGLATAAGDQIGEVVQITYSGTAATLSAGTSDTHDHSLTATDDAGGGLNADGNASATDTVSSDQDAGAGNNWLTTVAIGDLTIAKYVRNNSDGTQNPAGPGDYIYNGIDYWAANVTGDTADVLEYLVVISNTGVGVATNVVMTDAISTFLALNAGNISLDETNDGAFETVNAVGSSDATVVGSDLTVFAGVGGADPNGGSIAAAASSAIVFQATIQ